MRTFYELHVHRKDGSSRRHVTRGELPKVGDTVPATLAGEKVSAKVGMVTDPVRTLCFVLRTMDDDEDFHLHVAFCTRMGEAIAAGLENATIGVVTTPGTKDPRYVPAKPLPLPSSQDAMELA